MRRRTLAKYWLCIIGEFIQAFYTMIREFVCLSVVRGTDDYFSELTWGPSHLKVPCWNEISELGARQRVEMLRDLQIALTTPTTFSRNPFVLLHLVCPVHHCTRNNGEITKASLNGLAGVDILVICTYIIVQDSPVTMTHYSHSDTVLAPKKNRLIPKSISWRDTPHLQLQF